MTLNKISIKPLLYGGQKFSAVRSGASSENFPEGSVVSFEILFTVLTFSSFWVKPKGHLINSSEGYGVLRASAVNKFDQTKGN